MNTAQKNEVQDLHLHFHYVKVQQHKSQPICSIKMCLPVIHVQFHWHYQAVFCTAHQCLLEAWLHLLHSSQFVFCADSEHSAIFEKQSSILIHFRKSFYFLEFYIQLWHIPTPFPMHRVWLFQIPLEQSKLLLSYYHLWSPQSSLFEAHLGDDSLSLCHLNVHLKAIIGYTTIITWKTQ